MGDVVPATRFDAEEGPTPETEAWTGEAGAAFLESAPDAVVVVDGGGRVALVNARTEAMFGYPRRLLVGQAVEVLLPERFRVGHGAHRARYAAERGTRPMGAGLDRFGRRADGTEFPIDISLSNPRDEPGASVLRSGPRHL